MMVPDGSDQIERIDDRPPARKGRFSIAWLMAIISLIAFDIATLRAAYPARGPSPSPAFLAMVLPLANVMLLAPPRLRPSCPTRRFWIGFEIVGCALVLVLAYMDRYQKPTLYYPLGTVDRHFGPIDSMAYAAWALSFCTLTTTPPLLLLAWLGGRLASLSAKRKPPIEPGDRSE